MPELGEWATALAGSPWVFLLVWACATIDGFFPPLPSESVVIALAALSAAGGEPHLWLLGGVAAAGAFTGDQIAYAIGRRIPVRRTSFARSERAQRAVAWAEGALASRGAAFIIGARFIPVGRVAVNMTAGSVGFSRRRFSVYVGLAALAWSAYSLVLGVGAGHLLADHHPLVGVAVGAAGGLLTGVVVDRVVRRVVRAREGRRTAHDGALPCPAPPVARARVPSPPTDPHR